MIKTLFFRVENLSAIDIGAHVNLEYTKHLYNAQRLWLDTYVDSRAINSTVSWGAAQ